MPLQVLCPGCKKPLQLPDGAQGKQVRCPMCHVIFAVGPARPPAPPPPSPSPPPVPQPAQPEPTATSPRPAPPPKTQPRAPEFDTPPPRPRKKADGDGKDDRPRSRGKPKRDAADRPRSKDTPALHLVLGVSHDPDKELRGDYVGELTDTGLRLRQGDDKIRVKVGSPVKHRRRNQVEIEVDGRPVQFLVKGFARGEGPPLPAQLGGLRVNRHRLAADLAAFLSGDRDRPRTVGDYLLPWYLFAVAALPMGIPIITLGGWIPLIGALLLCGAAFAIVQRDSWSVVLRLGAALGLSAVGYGVVIGIFALVAYFSEPTYGYSDKPTLREKDWQTYKSPDGDFEALLPGPPEVLKDPYPGVQVKLSKPEVTFRVHYFTVAPERRLDLADHEARMAAPEQWPEMSREVLREYPQSERIDGGLRRGEELPYDFRMADSNPKRDHRVLTDCQFNRFGDRVYCATVITPSTNALDYDLVKFLRSVRVTYRPH